MKTSCNIASAEFISQVEAIEPSDTGPWGLHQKHRPCRLILKDGRIVQRAICVEDHRGFTTDVWIHPDSVAHVERSTERLPAAFASKLYAAGESGMGYEIFRLKMKDRTSHIFVTGNIVDFPDYPDGYEGKDVKAVYPHEGREESKHGYRQGRTFEWCFYVKD
jgi:hypothetical protein